MLELLSITNARLKLITRLSRDFRVKATFSAIKANLEGSSIHLLIWMYRFIQTCLSFSKRKICGMGRFLISGINGIHFNNIKLICGMRKLSIINVKCVFLLYSLRTYLGLLSLHFLPVRFLPLALEWIKFENE